MYPVLPLVSRGASLYCSGTSANDLRALPLAAERPRPRCDFMRTRLTPLFLAALALLPGTARSAPVDDYLTQARRAWERRETAKALDLAGKAIAAAPTDARGHLLRGTFHEALFQHAEAVA